MGQGIPCRQAAREFGCVPATAVRIRKRYVTRGLSGLLDGRRFNGDRKVTTRLLKRLARILGCTPLDFGWKRTTWTRELLGRQLVADGFPALGEATIGRALVAIGARLGMPKPVVVCPWPARERERRLGELRALAERATPEEPVFYEDEVDIHLNPRIGRDWMLRGTQRRIVTPGQNRKHYLAGALDARTGKVTWVDGPSKSSALFVRLLFRLVAANTQARRIHLILDNYGIHTSKRTRAAVDQFAGRIVLHFLPPYTPDANRIERLWRDLHGNVTRNHRRASMTDLLTDVSEFLRSHNRRSRSRLSVRLRDSESRAAI